MREASILVLMLGLAISLMRGGPATAETATLQEAIDAAPAGATIVVPPGVHDAIEITRPLTLEGTTDSIIDGGGAGTVVRILADDVTIRGLTIRASGDSLERENSGIFIDGAGATIVDSVLDDVLFGIYVRHGVGTVISANTIGAKPLDAGRRGDPIKLWGSPGSLVSDNVITAGRDVVLWYSEEGTVEGNRISGGRYGLHFMYSHDMVVQGNELTDNSVGAFLMYSSRLAFNDNVIIGNHGPSGYGLGLKDVDGVEATGNRFVGNRIGVYLDNSPTAAGVEQHFSQNLFAHNDVGVLLLPAVAGNVFFSNAFIENREQVGVAGSGTPHDNAWSQDGVGNHWSDFAGFDADGDGIGDLPHEINDLFSSLTDGNDDLLLFSGSAAARAVDAAARAFPTLRPEPKAIDPSPLIGLPAFVERGRSAAPIPTVVVGLALLGAAMALASVARSTKELGT